MVVDAINVLCIYSPSTTAFVMTEPIKKRIRGNIAAWNITSYQVTQNVVDCWDAIYKEFSRCCISTCAGRVSVQWMSISDCPGFMQSALCTAAWVAITLLLSVPTIYNIYLYSIQLSNIQRISRHLNSKCHCRWRHCRYVNLSNVHNGLT